MNRLCQLRALALTAFPLASCAADKGPKIYFSPVLPATSLMCWFVESDGQGHSGFACADGALGYPPIDGGGLFPTLDALSREIAGADLLHPVILNGFRGEQLPGWKLRALTSAELAALQPALQRN